jgi:antitoxin HicB
MQGVSETEALIRLTIEPLPEGGFVATSEDVPGLVAQGRTVAEAVEIAQDVARRIAESMREHGEPVPPALERGIEGGVTVVTPVTLER